jgi:Phytanoyl-CoA dioxygenase (PhyH)
VSLFSKTRRNGALAEADRLEAEGRTIDAVETLVSANREQPRPEIERRLVKARNHAFAELVRGQADPIERRLAEVPDGVAPLDDMSLPTISAADLSAEAIADGVLRRGCLLIRGLVPQECAEQLVAGIDRVFEARDAHDAGAPIEETTPWFEPFEPEPEYATAVVSGRTFVNTGSGTWIADSPRLLFRLLETFEDLGLREKIRAYLGERPAISVNKGTLRRLPPEGGTEWWHQDGAFLGEGIRSLNVWVALTECGRDAPGMDVVAKRLDGIVAPGKRGADFDWSLSDEEVRELAGDTVVRPLFEPGDALLFDHLFLHRTGTDPGMTETRYATETWFFAPTAYPDPSEQVPLVF